MESEYVGDKVGLVSQDNQAEGGHGQPQQYDGCLAADDNGQNKGHTDKEYQSGKGKRQEVKKVSLDV